MAKDGESKEDLRLRHKTFNHSSPHQIYRVSDSYQVSILVKRLDPRKADHVIHS